MDFLDILDFLIQPVLELGLCRGKTGIWSKKCLASFLLGAGNLFFMGLLFFSIHDGAVIRIIIGAIGTAFFWKIDWDYTTWWYREGRFGADPPWLDDLPRPKGDLMNTPPEGIPFHTQPEDIWKDMGVRE